MVTGIEIMARLFYDFLAEQEENRNEIRYVFVGFENRLLRRIASLIRSELGITVDVMDAGRGYRDVIDSRALRKPLILNVTRSRAGEFASLLTFKTFTNEFELPYQRPISRAARAFNLYDVSDWVIGSNHLRKAIETHFPNAKDKAVSDLTIFLESVWQYAQRYSPGLKYLLSPDAIVRTLATLNKARSFSLNVVAEALGFDPSLDLVSCEELEEGVHVFLRKSDRVRRRFLKGTFLEQRRRLSKLLENLVRGILRLLAKTPSLCEDAEEAEELIEVFDKVRNRRRIHVIMARNVEILTYSQSSMLPKSVVFGIQRSYDKEYTTSKFLPHVWDDVIKNFSKSKGYSKSPLILSAKDLGNVAVTFNFLEGYDFALQGWRR